MDILCVPPERAGEAATFVRHFIETAASVSPETPESLLDLVIHGKADFWLAYEGGTPVGVCFSQILQRPKDRIVNVLAIGGVRGVAWLRKLYATIKADGVQNGAIKAVMVRTSGRKSYFGLKPTGYYFEDMF